MNLTKDLRKSVVEQFKRNLTMSEIGVLHGISTPGIEGIIREWVVEQERKVLHRRLRTA